MEITIYCDQQLILMPQEQISLQPIGIAEDVMAHVSWEVREVAAELSSPRGKSMLLHPEKTCATIFAKFTQACQFYFYLDVYLYSIIIGTHF